MGTPHHTTRRLGENRNVGNLTLAELNVGSLGIHSAGQYSSTRHQGTLPPVVALFQLYGKYVIVMHALSELGEVLATREEEAGKRGLRPIFPEV